MNLLNRLRLRYGLRWHGATPSVRDFCRLLQAVAFVIAFFATMALLNYIEEQTEREIAAEQAAAREEGWDIEWTPWMERPLPANAKSEGPAACGRSRTTEWLCHTGEE